MKFTSTRDKTVSYHFHDAVFNGMAADGGLFIPERFPRMPENYINTHTLDLHTLAFTILSGYITDFPADILKSIIYHTLSFPIPLHKLDNNIYLLEVFHGPTLAFKDVGARFMANVIENFMLQKGERLTILVATSGDTGSAIANAFHNKINIEVCVLYPSGKISNLQEKQMTTLGNNIHAIEVDGTFDDCQKLVKSALTDMDLRKRVHLTTANSINLARLLPQIIYHVWGMVQLAIKTTQHPVLTVPSGNFGNLVSAIYAMKMGFQVQSFIAATNSNDVFMRYIKTGTFAPQPSITTYSNAMDVGNPSNFERLLHCFNGNYDEIRQHITAMSVTNDETIAEIRRTYDATGYILDPHTAVGVSAARSAGINTDTPVIVTSTAHPAKFPEVIKKALGIDIDLPEQLEAMLNKKKVSQLMPADYAAFKKYLLTKNHDHITD